MPYASAPLLRQVALAAVLGLAVSGCTRLSFGAIGQPIVPAAGLAEANLQGCGHNQLLHLVGQPFTELAKYRLPGQLRVLRPGQGITRDLMPDRLNAQVETSGVILRLFCG